MDASVSRSICEIGFAAETAGVKIMCLPSSLAGAPGTPAGFRDQLLQQPVGALILGHPRDLGGRILQVAEDDRLRRTGRGEGRDVTVADRTPLELGLLSPPRDRWTQKVHFSVTPRPRTVTSGLRPRSLRPVRSVEKVRSADVVRAVVSQ